MELRVQRCQIINMICTAKKFSQKKSGETRLDENTFVERSPKESASKFNIIQIS